MNKEQIKAHIELLERQLKQTREQNMRAAREYGSELATGSLLKTESDLEARIQTLRNQLIE